MHSGPDILSLRKTADMLPEEGLELAPFRCPRYLWKCTLPAFSNQERPLTRVAIHPPSCSASHVAHC